MKKTFLLLSAVAFISIPQAFSQNLMLLKPKMLELSKYRPLSGDLELRHMSESPKINLPVYFATPELKNLNSKVLESDLTKISCDGDFALLYDGRGYPFLQVNSIKACINEDGFVIAHSVGMPALAKDKIAASVRLIVESHLAAKPNVAINQAVAPKAKVNPNEGVFSIPKSGNSTVAK